MNHIGVVFSSIVFGVMCQMFFKGIQRRAIERGLGWYNPATGKFEWTDTDIQYTIYGKELSLELPEELSEQNDNSHIYKLNKDKK